MKKKVQYGVWVMIIPNSTLPGGEFEIIEYTVDGIVIAKSRTLGI